MNARMDARILQLERRLSSITRLSFRSRSGVRSQCHWSGHGHGLVDIFNDADGSLIFRETGHFRLDALFSSSGGPGSSAEPRSLPFRNVFRWLPGATHVALSHERRGPAAPVWLFDLVPVDEDGEADFISHAAHRCIDDGYRATLWFKTSGFDLEWIIAGPRKDERLYYRYR